MLPHMLGVNSCACTLRTNSSWSRSQQAKQKAHNVGTLFGALDRLSFKHLLISRVGFLHCSVILARHFRLLERILRQTFRIFHELHRTDRHYLLP